jgi:AcrR family transcriptional regulator
VPRKKPSVPHKVLRKRSGGSRREEYSAATRAALVEVALELFTEHGYAATSLAEIVAGARVTKGALYHHFSGKQALFEAVFEQVEDRATASIAATVHTHEDPWEKAQAGLAAFLEVLQEPAYRRVVISEGPAVLGYERFREQEHRSTYGIVQEIVSALLASQRLEPSMVETFSRVFFGAMSAAGAAVSSAPDPARASREVDAVIGFILSGLRRLDEAGAPLVVDGDPDDQGEGPASATS